MSRGNMNIFTTEQDDFERKAAFFLFTRPVDDPKTGNTTNNSFHHWTLIVQFEDESVRTIEGIEDSGKLTPRYKKVSPQDFTKECNLYRLHKSKLSPLDLHNATSKNSLNNTEYNCVKNNSQHWLKEFAKLIDASFAAILDNYKTAGVLCIIEKAISSSFSLSSSSRRIGSGSLRATLMRSTKKFI